MGAKQITPMSEVEAYLDEQIERIEQLIIYNLSYVGEQCLTEARNTNSYKDQTGNLRSSIGYTIVKDGRVIRQSDFAVVRKGSEGKSEGEQFARSLASKFPEGIVRAPAVLPPVSQQLLRLGLTGRPGIFGSSHLAVFYDHI